MAGLISDDMRDMLAKIPRDGPDRQEDWDLAGAIAAVGNSGPALPGFESAAVKEAQRQVQDRSTSAGEVFDRAAREAGQAPAEPQNDLLHAGQTAGAAASAGTGAITGNGASPQRPIDRYTDEQLIQFMMEGRLPLSIGGVTETPQAQPTRRETAIEVSGRAQQYLDHGDLGQAVPLLRAAVEHERNPVLLLKLGAALQRAGANAEDLQEAQRSIEEAMRGNLSSEARQNAASELAKIKKTLEFESECTRLLPQLEKQVERVLESGAAVQRSETLQQLLKMAREADELGAYGLGIAPLRQALRLQPDSPGILNDLAVNLAVAGGQDARSEVAGLLRRAIECSRPGSAFNDSAYIAAMGITQEQYAAMIEILPAKLQQITR